MKRILAGILSIFASSSVYAYGTLAEYVSASASSDSDIHTEFADIENSDILQSPRVPTSSAIQYKLCTGGTAYGATIINSEPAGDMVDNPGGLDQEAQLLADLNKALGLWENAGGGTTLNLDTAVEDAGCGPDLDEYDVENPYSVSGANRIVFTDYLSPGIIGFAATNLTIVDGVLVTESADILLNVYIADGIKMRYNTELYSENTSTSSILQSLTFSFLGIVTHELGHVFGLSHSPIFDGSASSMATMFPAVSSLDQSRELETLHTDDELGIQSLYSPSGFPNNVGGTVSGYVKFSAESGARGAHVYAYDIDTEESIAGTFTGMDGTFASTEGRFTIKGIPLNRDFVLIVEPLDRTSIHPNLDYRAFNSPILIEGALNSAIRSFAVETIPDVDSIDPRSGETTSDSPGIDDATRYRLTSDSKTISGVTFYISSEYTAPNDAVGTEFSINENRTITASNPLQVTLTVPTDLSIFEAPTISLTANRSGDISDWSDALGDFSYSGTSSTVDVDTSVINVPNGTYNLALTLTDTKYLDVGGIPFTSISGASGTTIQITVNGWDGGGGGGGGCVLDSRHNQLPGTLLWLLIFLILGTGSGTGRRYRKSFTS